VNDWNNYAEKQLTSRALYLRRLRTVPLSTLLFPRGLVTSHVFHLTILNNLPVIPYILSRSTPAFSSDLDNGHYSNAD
jgi:hypothetical protein